MSIVSSYIVPHPPLIIPEVGRGDETLIGDTVKSFQQIAAETASLAPETLVISSPHAPMYRDCLHISGGRKASGDFARFRAPQVSLEIDYDEPFVQSLVSAAQAEGISCISEGDLEPGLDHGTLIPLYFVQKAWQQNKPFPKVVRVGISGLSLETHYQLGKKIAETANTLERRVVFIASGDLSHRLKKDGPYGFAAEGPQFDHAITEIIKSGDLRKFVSLDPRLADKAGECGWRSFAILAGAMDGVQIKTELLSYEGTFGVGYAVARVFPQ
jgi:AmmeMemoRadiSam system protein B